MASWPSGTSPRSTEPAAITLPNPTATGPTAPPGAPGTPAAPEHDATGHVADQRRGRLSPQGVLQWMYDEPPRCGFEGLVPPAIRQSQKLIRLPRVTRGKGWSASARRSGRRWPPPRAACPPGLGGPAQDSRLRGSPRKVYPPFSATFCRADSPRPSPAPRTLRVTPAEITVRPLRMRHPGWIVTPSAEIRSTSTSAADVEAERVRDVHPLVQECLDCSHGSWLPVDFRPVFPKSHAPA